jgi:uncharacterized membrane protein YbaN (DUF454 family)
MVVPVAPPEPARRTPSVRGAARRVVRWGWIAAGFVSVAIGGIGVVVPGLPTTVFFVMAAWCFGRSSPRFEQWVLNLPKVGPLVRDYRAGLGMPRRAKQVALSSMGLAVAFSAYLNRDRAWLAAVIVAAGVVGSAVVLWWVPTRAYDDDEDSRGG